MRKKALSEMTLEELWQLFPIVLEPYNPDWLCWYREEEDLLKQHFGSRLFRVRHIGSTSVPGLLAKPTVDILLEAAPDTLPETLRELGHACNYTVMAESGEGDKYRLDLCKGYTQEGFAERVFHLHIRYPGDWDEPVFCAFLRRHQECAAEYAKLKSDLKERFEHDRDGCTGDKGDFIRFWTAAAREEIRKQQ